LPLGSFAAVACRAVQQEVQVKKRIGIVCTALLSALSANAAGAADPKKLADALTGDAKGSASQNPQCKLFTTAEIAKYLEQPVEAGQNAAQGTGCQWLAKSDDSADAIVQVVPSRHFVPPSGAQGFKPLPNVGTKGFVAPEYGGWSAGAIDGDAGIWVNVSGKGAKASTAIALLEETIKRRKRQ
jgi:hypothetical protein